MKKTTGIIFTIFLAVVFSLTLFGCTGNSQIDFASIDTVTVDETSIEEGFLLSEFDISKVKLNVQYFSTIENGNEVEGEIISVPVTMDMVKAEDKAKLRVPGTKTIHIVAFSKFELEFVLTLYDSTVTTYTVVFLDENGDPLYARTDTVGYQQYVVEGGRAVAPTVESKSGYTFVGWTDRSTGRLSSYDNITKDTTFVATYEKNEFEIKYYSRAGGTDTLIATVKVQRGKSALTAAPEIPVLVGYSNGRWENESAMKSVTADASYYAIYDKDQVNVGFTYKMFSANDETNLVKYDVGGQVLNPPGAEYPGFKFVEWRLNGKKVTFPYTVTSEVVFEAYYVAVANGNAGLNYTENAAHNGVSVSGYVGQEDVIVIPENVSISSTIYDVTEINAGVFRDVSVQSYVVSENNRYFITEDNVLFNREKTVLLAYPSDRKDTTYVIPDSVTSIAPYAFYGAKNLQTVTLGAKVESIGDFAFAECAKLTSFAVNDSVRTIGEYAFYVSSGESALRSFTFSAASVLTSIGRYAFAGLNNVSSYALPSSLTSIGSGAFAGNKTLSSVTAVNNVSFRVSGGALYSADYSVLYVYPALYDGLEFPTVDVDDRCERIVSGAFSYARISGVVINSVLTVEFEAFDCPTLRYFRVLNALDMEFGGRMFADNVPSEIVVPLAASSLHDRLAAIQAFSASVRYEQTTEPSARAYFSDYYYEQYTFIANGTQNTGVRLLGTRSSSAVLALPDNLNGNPVTAIADKAFAGDKDIVHVTLPAALQYIGNEAFYGCANIESVNFGAVVTSIGDRAFAECGKLSSVTFSDELDSISSFGVDVFRNTPYVLEATEDFIVLGNVLVKYNGYVTAVNVPSTVGYIATDAFGNKGQITTLNFLGAGLKVIDSFAFQYCSGLISITFPASLSEVKRNAFFGCDKLFVVTYAVASDYASLTIDPEAYPTDWYTVTQVYTDSEVFTLTYRIDANESHQETGLAFTSPYVTENTAKIRFAGWFIVDGEGNVTDTLATFPLKLTENMALAAKNIDASASTEGLQYRYDESTDSYAVTDYIGVDDYIIVPARYKNRYVRYIDANAFSRRTTICYIELPNRRATDGSVLSEIEGIGQDAFSATEWYNKFLGDFITIDDYLIKYTGEAETVYIPAGVTRLAEGAFAGNASIKTVVFPSGLSSIAKDAFKNCTSLEKVVFPESLTTIGYGAFSGCTELSSINFADCDGLEIIAYDAFDGTAWLNDYVDGCVLINNILYRYVDNPEVHVLHVYNGIVSVNERAFYGNVHLRSVHIPQSVTIIGESAFEGSSVNEINLFAGGSNLTDIRAKAFKDSVNLNTIDLMLSKKLSYIGDYAFAGCLSLRDVTVPATVTGMGVGVFMGSALRTVNFASDSKLASITEASFKNCTSLFSVNFSGSSALTTIEKEAFYGCVALSDFNNLNGSIVTIGDKAFYNCASLTTFAVNSSRLQEIGDLALENVGYVQGNDHNMVVLGNILIKYNGFETVVQIPANVTSIYNAAFKGNTRITDVVFPENSAITSVNAEAFAGCANLANINFPETIVNVGEDVVIGTEWYNSRVRNGEEYIVIANTLIRYNAGIAQQAVLPDRVAVINRGAFDGATVYDIKLSENVTLIKEGAFDGIDISVYPNWTLTVDREDPPVLEMSDPSSFSAQYILLQDAAVMDGYRLDANWSELYSKMKVPHKVTVSFSINESKGEPIADIVTNAIYSEIDVTTKTTEDLTYIFVGWYTDDHYDQKVSYPLIMPDDESLRTMTLYAKFTDNSQGSNADLYEVDGEEIKLYGFELDGQGNVISSDSKIVVIGYLGDTYMKTVGSGYYLDENGHYTSSDGINFDYEANPGEGATRYSHRGAFENHVELVEVYFTYNSQIETIGPDAFKNCTGLERVVLPSSIKRICAGAFEGCSSLREIVFPSDGSDIVIETNAFKDCVSLRSVTLPESVEDVADGAFAGCTELMDIYLKDSVAIVIGNALPFEKNDGMIIHIPYGSYNSYVATWSEYAVYLQTEAAPASQE